MTTSYPQSYDGSEAAGSFVSDFAVKLSESGIDVVVVAPSSENNKVEKQENLTICRFKVDKLPLSNLTIYNPLQWISIVKTIRSGARQVELTCREYSVDHVFALWAMPSGYWAYRAFRKLNISYSIWALGSDIWSLAKIPIVRNILAKVLKSATENYADGIELASQVRKISGKNCQFLASSRELNVSEFKQLRKNPPYKLTFIGRWHINKGPDIFLEALAMLSEVDWQRISSVEFAGGGPMEETVVRIVNRLIKEGKPIKRLGFVDKKQAKEMILNTDFLVIPSRIESIPVIFSDAVQCSTAVICTPTGDLPKLLNENMCGELAESISSESLARAIHKGLSLGPLQYQNNEVQLKLMFSLRENVDRFVNSLKN
ncbi:MAG: glycosyltransferase [Kangiellaceae bacterium]|nr:glycosyltransferase [Kangiellaceae bacterium]MCW8997645.1 glycosyltransferase [Kangiellaceae bacterium]MCW9018414.1 glycosyltransferase [Kangiellaceae bacterium]